MSKLGFHVNFITNNSAMYTLFSYCQPKVIKSLRHDSVFWSDVKSVCPNTKLVGRYYVDKQPLDSPDANAAKFANYILNSPCAHIYDVWEGYNEISRDKLTERCKFDMVLAGLLHKEGIKYCCGSWSVGVPDIEDWLRSCMRDALEASDAVSCHEYCAPTMNDPRGLIAGGTMGWFTLRYRQWYPGLPPECQKPLIISECGVDSGAPHWPVSGQGGWRSFMAAPSYLEQLKWYDSWLMRDSYVVGGCIFCYGTLDPRWDSYDVTGEMATLLAEYIYTEPAPTPPSPGLVDLDRRISDIESKLDRIAAILG